MKHVLLCLGVVLAQVAHGQVREEWTALLADGRSAGKILFGADRSIFVMGGSWGVAKYDRHGEFLWQSGQAGLLRSMALDSQGNLIYCGFDGVVKVNGQTGALLWRVSERCQAVTTGPGNSVIISLLSTDVHLKKRTSEGLLLWDVRYDHDDEDSIFNLQVSPEGEIFASGWTGYHHGVDSQYMLVTKFSQDGALTRVWSANIGTPCAAAKVLFCPGSDPIARAVRYYAEGGALFKLNPAGGYFWTADVTGFTTSDAAIDTGGNVYIGGSRPYQNSPDYFELAVAKFSSNGQALWEHAVSPNFHESLKGTAFALDSNRNAYIGGQHFVPNVSVTPVLYKVDELGTSVWRYEGLAANFGSTFTSLALDDEGGLFAGGSQDADFGGDSLLLRKLTQRETMLPISFEVVSGELHDGDLESLHVSDDQRLICANTNSSSEVVLRLVPAVSLSTLFSQVIIEGYCSRADMIEEVRLLSPSGQKWNLASARIAPPSEVRREIRLPGLRPVQIIWQPINDESPSASSWSIALDQATWEIVR